MQVTSGIQCNLLSPSYSTIYAPQGDAQSRFVLIQLLEGATPWEVPAGASVIIRAAKPDGTFCFYDTNEAEESAYSVSGSTVTIELVGQVLAAPGPVLMQVDFYNADGAHLSTFTFCCQVSESVVSDEDIVSSDYFSVLTATLTEMQQIEQAVKAAYGAPLVAATAAAMTDHTRVYVYTGSESGYINGNWYYWNGTAWAIGGVYNSSAINVDSAPTEGSTNPVSSGGTYAADTALGDELDDLTSAFETFSGEQQLTGWRSDYPYLTNTTEPVNFEPVNRNTAYVGLAVECSPGDVFTITASASNTAYRAYAWLDADKYVIYKTPNNQSLDRAVITAPEGAAYLVVNSQKSYNPYVSKGQNRLEVLENNIVGFPILSLYSTLGVIGDSWASGGVTASSDDFPHSWPQIVGRCYGVDATNFSHVGLTAKSWLSSSYGLSKLQNDDAKGLYICALGINDSAHPTTNPVGTVEDIETEADTFYGNYGKIIKAIQAKAPTAKICISTIPQYNSTANISDYNTAIENIASHFSIQLLVVADDKFFKSSYFVDNLAGNHPPLPVYAGIADAYNRMISAACISNAAYWNA